MNSTFLELIGLLGILLSFFLVILIWCSASFRTDTHKYFALAIVSLNLSLTVALFENYLPANGIMEVINWPYLFPFAFMIYVLKAIKDPLSSSRKIWILALPCVILSAFQMVDFTAGFDVYAWMSGGNDHSYTQLIELTSLGFAPYSIVLIGFSYVKIQRTKDLFAREKKWLNFNVLSILIFCMCWLFSDQVAALFDVALGDYLLGSLGIFLSITTYRGVHHLNVFEQRRHLNQLVNKELKKDRDRTTQPLWPQQTKKRQDILERLKGLMANDQLYLNPSLTRSMVAEKLGLSDGYLSELISSGLKSNFNDYINEFRVDHAIEMFKNEKYHVFSIEAIGYESGFQSKSVFYKAFKKRNNETPGAYRKRINRF